MPIKKKILSTNIFQLIEGLKPFNNISQTGHWKQLTVRTSRNGDVMVWAILHPQDMSDDDRKKLKDKFVEHFENEQGLVTENGLLFGIITYLTMTRQKFQQTAIWRLSQICTCHVRVQFLFISAHSSRASR